MKWAYRTRKSEPDCERRAGPAGGCNGKQRAARGGEGSELSMASGARPGVPNFRWLAARGLVGGSDGERCAARSGEGSEESELPMESSARSGGSELPMASGAVAPGLPIESGERRAAGSWAAEA
uniref:Uncharacterized protein n=1 Tax=Ananas comosus var. bracteatus TaxID=296719 RepID=A0A6V7PLE4_ANACO|nr:unnamed protein product [Ananas comosus var. bracteatus]